MPQELDQAPQDTNKPASGGSDGDILASIATLIGKRSEKPATKPASAPAGDKEASMAEYDAMLEDRPAKMTSAQAGFVRGGVEEFEHHCGDCSHFFESKDRSVCEIVRPNDGNEDVEREDKCKFFTTDLENYPALKTTEPKKY